MAGSVPGNSNPFHPANFEIPSDVEVRESICRPIFPA